MGTQSHVDRRRGGVTSLYENDRDHYHLQQEIYRQHGVWPSQVLLHPEYRRNGEDEAISYSRTGNGYTPNLKGIYTKESSDVWKHAFQASGGIQGWPAFEATTNSILDNRDMTTVNWTDVGTPTITHDQTGIDDAANAASQITDNNGTGVEGTQQDITIADNSNTHTFSIYISKSSGSDPTIRAELLTGTTEVKKSGTVSVSDGVVTGDGSTTDEDDWWRWELSVVNNGTGNTTARIQVEPADGSTTGSCVVDMAQIDENQSYAGPPIETGSSTATRDADTADVTGLDTAPWFDGGKGSIYVRYISPIGGTGDRIAAFSDGTTNNRIILFADQNEGQGIRALVSDGGTTQADINSTALSDNVELRSIFTWEADNFRLVHEGATIGSDTAGSIPSVTRLDIGKGSGGTKYFNSYIQELIYFPYPLPEAKAQSITS